MTDLLRRTDSSLQHHEDYLHMLTVLVFSYCFFLHQDTDKPVKQLKIANLRTTAGKGASFMIGAGFVVGP